MRQFTVSSTLRNTFVDFFGLSDFEQLKKKVINSGVIRVLGRQISLESVCCAVTGVLIPSTVMYACVWKLGAGASLVTQSTQEALGSRRDPASKSKKADKDVLVSFKPTRAPHTPNLRG